MATCYRHPDRETGVSCANCGKPICPDCMTPTPVGMRCPECSRQTTKVRNMRAQYDARPVVTIGLIAINVLIFFGMSSQGGFGSAGGTYFRDYALFGPAVADGEYYRLITSGFLHSGLLHIGFNMYILWFLGNALEPALGPVKFAGLYLASLLAGSFGALLLSPDAFTVGASGAVFGLMGATFVMQRARGIDPMQSGIGILILLNLGIGFLPGLNISVGGHLGGLIGGALVGFLMDRAPRGLAVSLAICVAVAAAAVAGSYAVVQQFA
jgi:membrane associated rhomboid family serine protease